MRSEDDLQPDAESRMSFHPLRRKVAVFTDLGRPRVGDEAKAQSKLYPSSKRRLFGVLAHGGVGYVNDGRAGQAPRPSDPKER
jgi:hypothetical protein